MLAIDLGVFHRKAHAVGLKEAGIWSAVWVALAIVFNVGVYFWFGSERALEFTTGYLIEKALAVDNIFIFVVIFSTFAVPAIYQHRVLFWGVVGALAMRAVFILAGGAFLQRFHWAIYLFGALLAITGVKLLLQRNKEMHPERNPLVRAFRKVFPTTPEFHGDRFTVLRNGRRYATPLLLALVAVEVTDLIFAVDSIPAIFAITTDPFIVFTSNIFAILGLRSLYFLLAGVITKFAYLKVGLSFVLIFVGAKMLLMDVYKVPIGASLGAIAGILGLSIVVSLVRPARAGARPAPES
ncbi:MAG: TerC family protein [Planctomycetes bacterium]|nr:TerC family protein [Planctomycetota bacterium]